MDLLTRRSIALAMLAMALGGCVHESQCVEGARRGPDGRCVRGATDGGTMDGAPLDTSAPDTGRTDSMADSRPPDSSAPDTGSCSNDGYVAGRANLCNTPENDEGLSRADYGPTGDETIEDVAFRCVEGCLTSPTREDCITACIVTETMSAITDGCASCYGALGGCVLDRCAASCLDRDSEECIQCVCGADPDQCVDCHNVLEECGGVIGTFCDAI